MRSGHKPNPGEGTLAIRECVPRRRYNSSGACTEMPSTRFTPGLGVEALSCRQSSGLVCWPERKASLQSTLSLVH